jgi:hypothetical protein
MKQALLSLLVVAGLVTGCASQPKPKPVAVSKLKPADGPVSVGPPGVYPMPMNRPQAYPACFPYHSPMAQGPGPSLFGFAIQGAQPLFSGAPLRVVGDRWAGSSSQVTLLLLPQVKDAMWYGTEPGLINCLGAQAQVLGEASVKDGHWQWEGKLPAKAGESPVLVAVDQDGTYYLEGVQLYGAPTVTKPYSLSLDFEQAPLAPDAGAKLYPPEPTAVWPIALDRPFRLAGKDLAAPDGPVLIQLDYADETGSDWVLMGTGSIKGGLLTTEALTIPTVLEFLGGKHQTKAGTYQLIVTSDQRPLSIYLTQSIKVQ